MAPETAEAPMADSRTFASGWVWLVLGAMFLGTALAQETPAAEGDAESAPPADATLADDGGGDSTSANSSSSDSSAGSAQGSDVEVIPVAQPPAEAGRKKRSRVIEEIIVTATKREESLRDIPSSITALKGEDLERTGAQGQDDFLKLVPGVTLYDTGVVTRRITIRGIATLAATGSTGLLVGDVPFTDAFLQRMTLDPNPFDLASTEVLKGPQGTLFGASGLAGAIRYVPEAPVLGEWQTKTFATFESVGQGDAGMIYGAAVNIPVYDSDTLAFRLVGHNRNSAGWIDEFQRGEKDVNQAEQTGGRALALWQPNERWKVTAMVMAQNYLLKDYPFADNGEGRLSRSNTPRPSPISTDYDLETIGVEYGFDGFDLLSQTSRTYKVFFAPYDASRLAGDRPPPNLLGVISSDSEGYMQEFRVTSNAEFDPRWKWLVGTFAQRVTLADVEDALFGEQGQSIGSNPFGGVVAGSEGFVTEDGQANTARFASDVEATELALYGEATQTFWDALELTLGLRVYRISTGGTVSSSGALFANSTITEGRTETVNQAEISEQGFNPKLALQYPVNDNIGLYLSVAKGFRFGGIQFAGDTVTADVPETFKSDTVWSYELGLRTQWFENTLVADLTPFYIDWITPQIGQYDPNTLTSWIDNVGGARSRGVELALQYLPPIDGLSLALSAAWVDTVTTVPFTAASGAAIEPGTEWPQTAKYQTATTLSYDRNIGPWSAGAALVHTYIGKAWINLEQTKSMFDYQTLDLQLNASNQELNWLPQLSLSLNNLADERGVMGVSPAAVPDTTYIRPRTLILRMGAEF